jgi:hypothetical protein
VRQCTNLKAGEAETLIAAWQQNRRNEASTMNQIKAPNAEAAPGPTKVVFAEDEGCVEATVDGVVVRAALVDSGADDSVVSKGVV